MKKPAVLLVAVILVIVLVAAVYPAYAESAQNKLVRLKLINKSDQVVNLQLSGDEFYYLTVPANGTAKFTVKKGVYTRQTWACGATSVGTLDMSSQAKLNFIPCEMFAPNQGEATQEKVSLYDSPTGVKMRYQDE